MHIMYKDFFFFFGYFLIDLGNSRTLMHMLKWQDRRGKRLTFLVRHLHVGVGFKIPFSSGDYFKC